MQPYKKTLNFNLVVDEKPVCKFCTSNFYDGDLPYIFYKNFGSIEAGGPDALFFKLKKRIAAAAAHISGDEHSDIVGPCNFVVRN
ncbi:hypothetical protein C0J27_02890 [Candidatus Chromulinivorax destructor]|uniref:Uncharacterized protein n=1 Tax=Candidatus Chromulinivorax destructor TaxID=2066483 RepID=A0A345ZBK9_9BACT|nr:hypothetical protein C0J27_02890 [Candidatus Chromulinivorax destructor]